MEKVYLLTHVRVISEEDSEDMKIIGIYSTKALAEEAFMRKKLFEGFRDFPDGFEIACYELNRDYWSEGFITVKASLAALNEK